MHIRREICSHQGTEYYEHQLICVVVCIRGDVQVLLMTLVTLTGNYGFYPLLTLTLCLSLIDDSWLNSWTGSGLTYKGWSQLRTTQLSENVFL